MKNMKPINMENRCPLAAYHPEINESRCLIPYNLPHEATNNKQLESFYCPWNSDPSKCEVVQKIMKFSWGNDSINPRIGIEAMCYAVENENAGNKPGHDNLHDIVDFFLNTFKINKIEGGGYARGSYVKEASDLFMKLLHRRDTEGIHTFGRE